MSMKFLVLFMGISFFMLGEGNTAPLKCYPPGQSTPVGNINRGGLLGEQVGWECYTLYPKKCADPKLNPKGQCTSLPSTPSQSK